MSMEHAEAMTELRRITKGIDLDDSDSGWWETSVGAEFGAGVLAELERLVADLTDRTEVNDA